jgi:hypothetical protein
MRMNIAMWSGPRNLSTAMMYSFGARENCDVWDEPFYAPYLENYDTDHALRAEIIAANETNVEKIAAECARPRGRLFYQKHMPHHMLDGFPLDWVSEVTNVFLIRHPARVIVSYHAKQENPDLQDIGAQKQTELFHLISQKTGKIPVVVDASDIRENPRGVLTALCAAIDIPFEDAMLKWPAGGHKDDGPWAPHWYGSVWKSTGFAGAENPLPSVPKHLESVLAEALPFYNELAALRIRAV